MSQNSCGRYRLAPLERGGREGAYWGGKVEAQKTPKGDAWIPARGPSHNSKTGPRVPTHVPLVSYRFKRSPFKELISDLSSLRFWDSRIQLVDEVA